MEYYKRSEEEIAIILNKARTSPIDWNTIYRQTLAIETGINGFEKKREYVIGEIEHELKLIEALRIKENLPTDEIISKLEKKGQIFGAKNLDVNIPQITDGSFSKENYTQIWETIGAYTKKSFNDVIIKPRSILVKLSSIDSELLGSLEPEFVSVHGISTAAEKHFNNNPSNAYRFNNVTYVAIGRIDAEIHLSYNIFRK